MKHRTRLVVGAGASLGAIAAAPAAAQAEDFTVTNLNDSGTGSLREAIEDANGHAGADRVLFKSRLSGEITLTSGVLFIQAPTEIIGPGARKLAVSGNGNSTIFAAGPIPVGSAVRISGLRLTDGQGSFSGGAIYSSTADLTLSEVVISGSTADAGGGIAATGPGGGSASLTVEDSTITGNSALGTRGGGILAVDRPVTIANSTISGNSAGTYGGGVYARYGYLEVRSSTVAGNTAGDLGGGLYEYAIPVSELRGTIVADNDAPTFLDLDDGPWEGSFNLVENPGTTVSGSSNIFGVDPNLKPLANNGGPTDTHAFKKSPAKNAGPSDAPDKDQRGAPRKGQPDIGAYEFTKCKGAVVNRVGTSGKDKLKGTKRKDGMLGLGGNNKLKGKKGKDGLCGGRGKDKLIGGPGKDKFNGGPGKDKEIQ